MNTLRIPYLAFILLISNSSFAIDPNELIGKWVVDLRPTPDAEPYLKTLQIDEVQGNSFTGSFYDTPFTDGVINSDWGIVQIAFTTEDGRISYHHSAEVNGTEINGRTHAPGRQMLSIWSAKKPMITQPSDNL